MARKKQGPAGKKQGPAGKKQGPAGKKQGTAPKKQATAPKKQATARKKPGTAKRKKPVSSFNRYRPSEGETFMNNRMTEYFRGKLLQWRTDLLQESSETLVHLQESSTAEPDLADRASLETDRSLELRTRDRERKLIAKIDSALARIEEGTYGFCEETMEPIAIRRLEARPIATLSIEAQERHERMERTHREE
jgi:DnaK suppressor protein